MDSYFDAWKKYAVFTGRSTRREFWWFYLLNTLILTILNLFAGLFSDGNSTQEAYLYISIHIYITTPFLFALLIPTLAAAVRRLHDTNRTGWWLLLPFLPVVGWLILIVFFLLDSQSGENRFGPNPKEELT